MPASTSNARPFPADYGIHELVSGQAQRTPAAIAVASSSAQMSYAELDLEAGRLGRHLRQLGVGPDRLVGIWMERSVDLVVALLAVMKAGGAYLPLEPEHPRDRVASLISQADPVLILSSARLAGQLPGVAVPVVTVDGDRSVWGELAPVAGPCSGPTDLAYVLYTSGSTGKPKGVMVEHRSLVNHLAWRAREFSIGPGDRILQKAPLGFDISVWEIFCPLICGAMVVMLDPGAQRDPRRLSAAIREQQITIVSFAPPMLQLVAEGEQMREWRSVRLIAVGGEVLRPELVDAVLGQVGEGVALFNLYGPTEATVISTFWRCRAGAKVIPIGRPIDNTEIYILDSDLRPQAPGMAGELYIGGVGVARGYLHQPDLTAERFLPNPFRPGERIYRSGDVGSWLEDGTVLYVGRSDDQLKVRGNRVEPGEIEAALRGHGTVDQALVVPRPGAGGVPVLVGYVVGRKGKEAPRAPQLRAYLEGMLPGYMVPSAILVLEQFPMAPSGKVNRQALPEPVYQSPDYVAPQGPLELHLATKFAKVLGLPRVGREDDFFLLGGHSLLAASLLTELESELRVPLSLAELFMRRATVAGLAAAIEAALEGRAEPGSPPVGPSATTDGPALFFVHAGEAAMLTLRHFVVALGPEQAVVGLLPPRRERRFDQSSSIQELAKALVATIREAQAQGPYLLAGFSLGGLVAYEMAGYLAEAGEEVAWLGVFDAAYSPSRAERALWVRSPAGLMTHLAELGPARSARAARGLVWRWVRSILVRFRWLPVEADAFDYRGATVLESRYRTAGHRVPMELFASEDSVSATGARTIGWEAVHQGPISSHVLPGGHVEMMTEPNVEVVTDLTRKSLLGVPALAGRGHR